MKLAPSSLTLALAASIAGAALADDRDLLRFDSTKPYVFVLLDTSSSMNLRMGAGDVPLEGHADDPASRLYGAKAALFSVLESLDDVHFGFAAFNQDRLGVVATHWLYYVPQAPASWPFQGASAVAWPAPDADGLTTDRLTVDTNGDRVFDAGDGVPDHDVEGDAMVFGARLVDAAGVVLTAGSCAQPIALDTPLGRRQINAFAKAGAAGNETTTIWLGVTSGSTAGTWRLNVARPSQRPDGTANPALGQTNLAMQFRLAGPVTNCASVPAETTHVFTLRLDAHLDRIVMIDRGPAAAGSGATAEKTAGLWPASDVTNAATCTGSPPFAGNAWEGNYDSGTKPITAPPSVQNVDPKCSGSTCVEIKPVDPTALSLLNRALDSGDMLPFRWEDSLDQRTTVMQRLAPNWPEQTPDFSVAYHLATSGSPSLPARVAGRPPLVADGSTPLEAAIGDFRCWYMGRKGASASRCSASAFYANGGWTAAACSLDLEYGCRRPYLLLITDGEETCGGSTAASDIAELESYTGVKTIAFNLGDPALCASGGSLHSMVEPAGGSCINVTDKDQLEQELAGLLGDFREQAQTFATAAVPSVQTEADQSVYISSFVPLNSEPVWSGRIDAFLKPVPLDDDGKPDVEADCDGDTAFGCHLWDAGEALLDQHNLVDRLGNAVNQRRIYYPIEPVAGTLPKTLRLFDPVSCTLTNPTALAECRDLLRGMNIPIPTLAIGLDAAAARANAVIDEMLTPREADLEGPVHETLRYLLGDVFHSDPLVVGPPKNFLYYTKNLYDDGTACRDDETGNPGYRCFFRRQRLRRQTLFVGSDDGMLHAFDAGRFRESGTDAATGKSIEDRYDNGTGHELFAFIPRKVLPQVLQLAEAELHQFTVDGTPVVADVFIDPSHDGTPTPADRRWRTILIGGLREGGSSYFALDITQPDRLELDDDGEPIPEDRGTNWVPSCLTDWSAARCGPVSYPSLLWESGDRSIDSILGGVVPSLPVPIPFDEDSNLLPDLGNTWSTPTVGRVRLCRYQGTRCDPTPTTPTGDDDLVDKYVAIFGGGMDPTTALETVIPHLGDWLYMVDIETGKVIYKRRLCASAGLLSAPLLCLSGGAAPGEPAAVDTDLDGYLDRIYVGTTGGFLYRVDLGSMANGNLPAITLQPAMAIETVTVPILGGLLGGATQIINQLLGLSVQRVQKTDADGNQVWEPRVIFDANWDSDGGLLGLVTATLDPRQIYHRPSVFFSARTGLYGLSFGTGNRENLWDKNLQHGRFYLFLDDTDQIPASEMPITEGDLARVEPDDDEVEDAFLFDREPGRRGWYLVLEPDERVITDSTQLSGLVTFASFQPETQITDQGGNPVEELVCGATSAPSEVLNLCASSGFSRTWVLDTRNGNGLLTSETGSDARYIASPTFVTTAFAEAGQLKSDAGPVSLEGTSDELSEAELELMEDLKGLFPPSCRFGSFTVDLKMITADTQLTRIAPMPVCMQDKNWKEE